MKHILIVEDEKDITELLDYQLKQAGYTTTIALDGEAGLMCVKTQRPDLILLDWMLPKLDGLDVCKQIKHNPLTNTIPIIMVSAKGDEFDKVLALEMGADDYLCKPFSVRELLARVKAHLRRIQPSAESSEILQPQLTKASESLALKFGDLMINLEQHSVSIKNSPLNLTKTEFDLLHTMANYPKKVFSREQLLYHVWGQDFYGDDRVVDVHIRRLRAKLESYTEIEFVQTVRGVGYKFLG